MEESYNSDYDNFHHHHSKKRKTPNVMEDTDESESCSTLRALTPTDESSKKQNHSEIEKRRRDKMNTFITELSGLVPMCSAMSRKLDKLTVLRMAVQHMKTLRGSRVHSYTEGHYKPSFVTDQELKRLILHCAEGFLFVVGCDRGRLLYVSESVHQVLKYSQNDLLGQSWFDILHPKDVAKVKEQLSSSDLSPRERLIDAKTMLPVKANVPQKTNRLCPGARRSFFCRMKCKLGQHIKEENDSMNSCYKKKKSSSAERKYTVVHCTGYLKSWAKIGMDDTEGEADDACNLSCLVAVGRILPQSNRTSLPSFRSRPMCYISRHTSDGKFVFVDQKATLVLGFLPQELLGTSMYEYYDNEEMAVLAEAHKTALRTNEVISTPTYQFRTRSGTYIKLHSTWKAFRNPWTKETEYLLARNTLIPSQSFDNSLPRMESLASPDFDMFVNGSNNNGGQSDIQRMLTDQMEASKIGNSIAEEMLDSSRRMGEPSSSMQDGNQELKSMSPSGMLQPGDLSVLLTSSASDCPSDGGTERDYNTEMEIKKKTLSVISSAEDSPKSSSRMSRSQDEENGSACLLGAEVSSESPHHTSSSDGNDEAAMAVIMSLLEADAGLGGPIDFSGLPWPLP